LLMGVLHREVKAGRTTLLLSDRVEH